MRVRNICNVDINYHIGLLDSYFIRILIVLKGVLSSDHLRFLPTVKPMILKLTSE